jgi:hypothetical protein
MDSPYRTSELEIVQSAGRADKRCTDDAAGRCAHAKRKRARFGPVVAWLIAGGFVLMAFTGLVAGVRACVILAEMKPHPVLLKCALPPPVKPAHVRVDPMPKVDPTPFDLPPVNLLVTTEPETHDPGVLAARALRMKAAGIPLNITVVGLPRDAISNGLGFNVKTWPIARTVNGKADGVELATIPRSSLLERAGLRQGDVVLSVNGYPAADPVWIDHVRADPGSTTVVELLRDKQREVLVLQWLPR